MLSKEIIKHTGLVTGSESNKYIISIAANEACGSCQAAKACGAKSTKEKIVEVNKVSGKQYNIGEKVEVAISQSAGSKALMLAYIIPLFIMVFTLFFSSFFVTDELYLACCAFFPVVVYYFILYLFRKKIEQRIKIEIIN